MNGKIYHNLGLTYDDVLLLPSYTDIKREEIILTSNLTADIKLEVPILSAPMDTVTTSTLAVALGKLGGLGVIHRNMTIESQAIEVEKVKKESLLASAAIGVGKDAEERAAALVKKGVDVIVVDSAHGFSKWVIELTKLISQKYKHLAVISGNVGTAAGAKALIEAGAKALRVGIGPGSICTTRVVAGIGVPQVTAIMETSVLAKKYNVPVIADGGIRYSGDIVKAYAAGASCVMSGSLFAGCDETPGEIILRGKTKYKSYRGMGSISAMTEGSASRYGQDYRKGQEKKLITEGVEGLVSYKGRLEDIVSQLVGGIRSGMYYTGARNIKELQEKSRFIQISQASLVESHPHDILEEGVSD